MKRMMMIPMLMITMSAPGTAAERVAPGVALIRGAFVAGSQPDGNSIILDAPDGLIVIDTGRHEAHTQRILDRAAERERPIAAIVNTHWHLDHIAGNALLRRHAPGVRVYGTRALEEARTGFLARYASQLRGAIETAPAGSAQRRDYEAELARVDAGDRLMPDVVVETSGERSIAGRPLELHVTSHAVTAADLWIFDRATGTIIAGDLVTLPVPFLDTACQANWLAVLETLVKQDFATLIPGHGPPMTKPAFQRYVGAFRGLLACGGSDASVDTCVDGWLASAGDLVPADERELAGTMTRYYIENQLRGDASRAADLCGE